MAIKSEYSFLFFNNISIFFFDFFIIFKLLLYLAEIRDTILSCFRISKQSLNISRLSLEPGELLIRKKIHRSFKCPVCGLYSKFERFHGDYSIKIKIIIYGGKIRGTGKGKGKAKGKIEWISDTDTDKIRIGKRLIKILQSKIISLTKKINLLEVNLSDKKAKKGKNKTEK